MRQRVPLAVFQILRTPCIAPYLQFVIQRILLIKFENQMCNPISYQRINLAQNIPKCQEHTISISVLAGGACISG
jgi:hypothetical protein